MATRKELREELSRTREQAFFSPTQICKMMGFKSINTAKKFIADLPIYEINGKPMVFVNDLAKKIDISRTA